jgi:hypothetical protein
VIRGFIGCPGAVEPGPDGGSDGPRAVFAGQPDLGGGVGERLSGRAGVEVAVGDQFTGPQARPKQQPVPFAAAGGQQAPDDAPQPGFGVRGDWNQLAQNATTGAGPSGICGGATGGACTRKGGLSDLCWNCQAGRGTTTRDT